MRIEANLNNVKDVETLPGGVYSAFISAEPTLIVSNVKKTPGLLIEFKLTDPGTEIGPGIPRTIRHTVWKSAEMGWEHFKMKELCEACGVTMDNPDTADFVNVNLKLAIGVDTFTNKNSEMQTKNQVEHFLKA